MRLPEVSWSEILPGLRAVHAHSPSALGVLADLSAQPKFPRADAGSHADVFVAAGLLEEVSSGRHLRHTPASRSLRVLLRAARVCRVVDAAGPGRNLPAMKEYLARNFTTAQRSVVLGGAEVTSARERRTLFDRATSAEWPRMFLELGDPVAFDALRAARVYGEPIDRQIHAETVRLVRAAADEPIRIPEDAVAGDETLFARAIETGIRYLLLFPRLRGGELVLGLQPAVRGAVASVDQTEAAVVRGEMPPTRPWLIEDAETVLLRASAHPIRVKADGRELYQRDLEDLCEALAPIPLELASEARVIPAVNLLLSYDALEHGTTASSRRCLNATQAGHAWLAEAPETRLATFRKAALEGTPSERLRQVGVPRHVYFDGGEAAHLWDGLFDCYRALPRDGGVFVDAFMNHRVESCNPLLREDQPQSPWLMQTWEAVVRGFLDWLASLGGVAFARHDDGLLVGATPLGDYLLGLRDESPAPAAPEARVVVQPNFDVVFLGPSPAAEAALARFSDRTDTARVGTLFRITQASVMRAGVAGLSSDDVLAALDTHTDGAPPNVRHEIATWLERVCRVQATSGIVVQCPDAATADRIEGALRSDAFTRVGETVLLATDRNAFDRAVRTLGKRGIVFDLDLTADPKQRKKPRRRSYRRW